MLYRADKRGYVFIHDESHVTDPKVDTTVLPNLWDTETIIHTYKSIAFNFGSTFRRKWVPRILLTAKNKTNVSIQVTAYNDDGRIKRPLREIRWRRNFVWGDPEFIWGNPSCVWNSEGLIEEWRRFPAKGLRLSYLQIEITNSHTIIINSDTIGNAEFDGAGKTATLVNAAESDWPEDCVDYYISTEIDGYSREFLIDSRSDDVITVIDPDSAFPTSPGLKWVMRGKKKGELLNLLSYCIHYSDISPSQKTYEAGDSGGNS